MKSNAGRPAIFSDKTAVILALRAIKGEEKIEVSRFLKLQLVDRGLVTPVQFKTGLLGRLGRPVTYYVLSNKGKTYLNFSKNWK
jgi:hypothetical protein